MTGDEWVFGWDAIAALAGVLAVVVASVLGWWGIRLAARAVERSQLDYVAERADRVADAGAKLKLLARAFDDKLNTLRGWPSGDDHEQEPDWMPVQQALNELEVHCQVLLGIVRGLHAATAKLAPSPSVDTFGRELSAFYAAHYVSYLYFTGAGGSTRDSLRQLYEGELAVYPGDVKGSVIGALDAVDPQTGVPNTVTTVNVCTVDTWTSLLDKLVLRSYEIASIDG